MDTHVHEGHTIDKEETSSVTSFGVVKEPTTHASRFVCTCRVFVGNSFGGDKRTVVLMDGGEFTV